MKNKRNKENYDMMFKNPDHWKGPFYANKNDPRIIVPKSNPYLGVTFNFGSIYTYIGMVVIILIILVFKFIF
jgi:uncharacterized membrane protein